MECTVVYGISANVKRRETMSAAEAFKKLNHIRKNWLFVDIYYNNRLVYTTQGLAGYAFICEDCPYKNKEV